MASNQIEVLVLSDENGNLYAIPRTIVEKHKLTGEQKTAMQQELGDDDVSGYLLRMGPSASQAAAAQASQAASASAARSNTDRYAFGATDSAAAAASAASASSALAGSFMMLSAASILPMEEV